MPRNLYASLIRNFVATCAPGQPKLTGDPGAMQFTVGAFICTIYPLDEGRRLVMECPVIGLADLDPDARPPALRLLHGLNWAARISTGIVAMVDQDGCVLVSKTLETRQLDSHQLEERMATLLDAASTLGTMLKVPPQAEVRPREAGMPSHAKFA